MAAVDELKNRLLLLESTNISRQQQRVAGLESEAKALRAAANSSNFKLPDQINEFKAARARATEAEKELQTAEADLSSLELEASNLKNEIAAAERADANAPAQSSGQTTAQAQQARDEGALPQNPTAASEQATSANDDAPAPTNATATTAAPTTGVNGELRPAVNTQSTPAATAEPGGPTPGNYAGDADAQPGGFYGAAAAGDDSGSGMNPVAQALQNIYGRVEQIVPQPNPLDRCASYTYNITIYLTTPELYSGLITNKKKSVSGMTVIIRSGGMSQAPTIDPQEAQQVADGQSAALPGAARNNNFPLDLYIDNLQIKSIINGKGTMSAHNATEMNFRVIEPNGITFIHSLQAATNELALSTGDLQNAYLSQVYLMAIRFYGWDENGNPVAPDTDVAAQQSDRTAITEKFIPFMFTGIKFKIANKLTEYDCSAVAVGNMIATGQQRGVIPYNFQITSTTLKDLLQKDLQTALNKYQADLCKANPAEGRPEPVFTYPDVYEFQLVPPLDNDAVTLKPPGDTLNTQTAMNPNATQDPRSALPAAQSVKSTTKLNSAFAGMSIVQFIDQMVRQSGYIYQQQIYITDPKTQKLVRQSGSGNLMAWYRISVQAVPDLQKWDPRRRDYAYKITYQVTPYLVTDVLSDYFPKSPRWTAPKEYRYWFTGQNNSIIDFTQDFNNLYYFVVNAPQASTSDSQLKNESKKGYQPASNVSSAGMPGKVNEPGSNAAQYLYSPADLARARMTIVGDPDWIQQGDVWAGIQSPTDFDPSIVYKEGPDAGAINYGSRETLFDIIFQTPADYDLNTGLITNPSATVPGPTVNGTPRLIEQRSRYKAVSVTNNFSQGKFLQDIEGVLILPDVAKDEKKLGQFDSEKSLTANNGRSTTTGSPDQSAAETRRLQSAANQAATKGQTFAERQQSASTSMRSAYRNAASNLEQPAGYGPPQPPTSNGETVGTASTPTSLFGQYGATGQGTGNPAVTFTTQTGRVITATNEQEIKDAFNAGYINKITQNTLTRQLTTLQQQANSPVNTAPQQTGPRDP